MPREGEGGWRRTAGALTKEPQLKTAAPRDTTNAFAFICDDHRPPLQQKMIVRARVVVTMDGPPIENGAVRVRGERIIEVGKFSDLPPTLTRSSTWVITFSSGANQRPLPSRLHVLTRQNSSAAIIRRLDPRYQWGKGQAFGRRLRCFDQPGFCNSETIWNNHHRESDRVSGIDRAGPRTDSDLVVRRTD